MKVILPKGQRKRINVNIARLVLLTPNRNSVTGAVVLVFFHIAVYPKKASNERTWYSLFYHLIVKTKIIRSESFR